MTVLEGFAILSLLVAMLACLYIDVREHAEHESSLVELWDDDEVAA